MIAVVDYGAGNLMSVTNALNFLGFENRIASSPEELNEADKIILPGVGAFPAAMKNLNERGFTESLRREALGGKPVLGICLGMQMLFELGYEIEPCPGLGLIPGQVRRIDTSLKLPHIGWNSLEIKKPCGILKGVADGEYVYFVHSYCGVTESRYLNATADYGEHVAGVVSNGNVYGCQFHPEKSGVTGLKILKNFCELREETL